MLLFKANGGLSHPAIAAIFVLFWVITLAAIFSKRINRKVYLGFFFGALLTSGFCKQDFWPFLQWSLWAPIQSHQVEYYELHIADAEGHVLMYDYRAVPPTLSTQIHGDMGRMLHKQPYEKRVVPLVRFLLERANLRRQELLDGNAGGFPLAYPSREFGSGWSVDDLAKCGPFTELVLLTRYADFANSPRGKPVVTTLKEERFK